MDSCSPELCQACHDTLQPAQNVYKAFYEKGFRTWHALKVQACLHRSVPLHCLDIHHLFPQHPYFPFGLEPDETGLATAITTWKPISESCHVPAFEQQFQLSLSVARPTTLVVTRATDIRLPPLLDDGENHLAVLVAAWAYALSARWAAVISRAAPLEYLDSQAAWQDSTSPSSAATVELGLVSDDAARWWAAVLAPGQGWRASIPHHRGHLLSPWTVTWKSEVDVVLSRCSASTALDSHSPPSFEAAVQYIEEYSALHSARLQNRAALATALLLPLAKLENRRIMLPLPRMGPGSQPGVSGPQSVGQEYLPQLDRLLMLSCNMRGIQSILGSVFYEPGIPSNVCGAWLQGTFAVLKSEQARKIDVLARMIFKRSPHISFLWLGALISGVHKTFTNCPFALIGLNRIDLHEAAWTGTLLSFIQEPVSFTPGNPGRITRADECRLAYLGQGLSESKLPPIFPYPPPGTTAVEDLSLDVRLHAACSGHHWLRCSKIKWTCAGGRVVTQEQSGTGGALQPRNSSGSGSRCGGDVSVGVDYSQFDSESNLSGSVTRNIFMWMREQDGFPVAERGIYQHEWFEDFSDDDSVWCVEGDAKSTTGRDVAVRVGLWASRVMTKRCNSL